MIVVRLRGRLGNQLFIYAFGRALQQKYNCPLVLIDNESDTGGTLLDCYNLPKDVQIVKISAGNAYNYKNLNFEKYRNMKRNIIQSIVYECTYWKQVKEQGIPVMDFRQLICYVMFKIFCRKRNDRERYQFECKHLKTMAKVGIFICENGYVEFPITKHKNIICSGYFQSEKYFHDVKEQILQELTPTDFILKDVTDFMKEIENQESVCLSIRMGDYINNPRLGVCTQNYYQTAIDKIAEMSPNAVIYVFSDDPECVRETFKFHNELRFEPEGRNEIEKLAYMSKCKYYILSNSSFSWWAQYLCKNENKVVIAPEKWHVTDVPCDIYMDNWLVLPV